MPDKQDMESIHLQGTALVFVPRTEKAVYKVELSKLAAGGDCMGVERFTDGAWGVCDLPRDGNEWLLEWAEENARRLAPEDFKWWQERLAVAPRGTQPERITRLVHRIMDKFDVPQKAVAERVGVSRQMLTDYSEGRGKGSGVTLVLALEALLARPVFGVPEEDQA